MIKKETLKNNKLIAEFRGWRIHVDDGVIQLYINKNEVKHIADLAYHSSLDLLIPVLEEIEDLGYYTSITTPINQKSLRQTHVHIDGNEEFWAHNKSKKIAIYEAVVAFIKWYNENKV